MFETRTVVIKVAFAISTIFQLRPSFLEPGTSAAGKIAVSGLTIRHTVFGKMILIARQFEIAHFGDRHGVKKRLRQLSAKNLPHLGGRTNVELTLFVFKSAFFIDRLAGADAHQNVVCAPVIAHQVMTVVSRGQRDSGLPG